jgi:hypothetical protein
VGRADVEGRKCEGTGSVPQHVQIAPHVGQPTTRTGGDVFDDRERRPELFDDPSEFAPETRARIVEPEALARRAVPLAGEASDDEVDGIEVVSSNGADVVMQLCSRPVLAENAPREFVDLDLPDGGAEAGALDAEVQASDAREERPDGHA